MPDFPAFIRRPLNRIARESQYTDDIEGRCTAILEGRRVELSAGQELHIPKGTRQSMAVVAGTRTMHVFGGRRAERRIKE